jgi:hypothetical protein
MTYCSSIDKRIKFVIELCRQQHDFYLSTDCVIQTTENEEEKEM